MAAQVTMMVWQIKVVSKRGKEHDDEDAWGLMQEKREAILLQGCTVALSRSFAANGTSTYIRFEAPKADKGRQQIGPEQFFPTETEFVTCEFAQVQEPKQEEKAPAAPEAAPAQEPNLKNVAG